MTEWGHRFFSKFAEVMDEWKDKKSSKSLFDDEKKLIEKKVELPPLSEDQYRYALNEEAHQLLKHLLPAPDPDSDELYPVTQEIFQKS